MHTLKFLPLATTPSETLDPLTKSFLPLVPEAFHPSFWGKNPNDISDTTIHAIGALDQAGHPTGIILAFHVAYIELVEIFFLYVHPSNRNQGIGRELLKALQQKAKAQGGKLLILNYLEKTPETPAIEKILSVNAWHLGQPFLLRCQFDGFKFNPPWIHKKISYPPSFQLIPFSLLNAADTKALQHRKEKGEFPALISPFNDPEHIEPLNSLVLKQDGRIVAWIVTHRLAIDTIRYTALYTERSLHFQGYGAQLLIDSIWLQKQSPVKWAVFELPLRQVTNSWTRFVKRRLVPFADQTTMLLQAWRNL